METQICFNCCQEAQFLRPKKKMTKQIKNECNYSDPIRNKNMIQVQSKVQIIKPNISALDPYSLARSDNHLGALLPV